MSAKDERQQETAGWTELEGAGALMRASAERDEIFWARQRARIRARASVGLPTVWRRYASTAAAALLLAASLLLWQTPRPKPSAGDGVTDEALLEQVESDLDRDAPQALLAASLSSEQEQEQ